MSKFLVSTTGFDATVDDLGLFLQDPTVDQDLYLDFTPEEVADSEDLTALIQSGDILLKLETDDYGLREVDGYSYEDYDYLEQRLNAEFKDFIVSTDELTAGYLDKPVFQGVFPIAIDSTTVVSNTLVVNTGLFQEWQVSPGNIVYINGGPDDGYYTVASVSQNNILTVQENFSGSLNAGQLTIFHEPASSIIGVNNTTLSFVSGNNLQEVLESIDGYVGSGAGGGITEPQHEGLDTLVHNLSEDYEAFPTFNSDGVITRVDVRDLSSADIRAFENFTIDSDGLLQTGRIIQYNSGGAEKERLDSSFTNTSSLPQKTTVTKT